jgi:hypothetical protein
MEGFKKVLTASSLAVVLGVGVAVPAAAQRQEGLVNVNVSDVDVGVIANVQAPIGIAANVCGVAVNVLATQLPTGADCDADVESAAANDQFMRFAEAQGLADEIIAALDVLDALE